MSRQMPKLENLLAVTFLEHYIICVFVHNTILQKKDVSKRRIMRLPFDFIMASLNLLVLSLVIFQQPFEQ